MVAKYVGDGGFLSGIPARDLEHGDWARLSDAQRSQVKDSPLYEIAEPGKPAKKKKDGK